MEKENNTEKITEGEKNRILDELDKAKEKMDEINLLVSRSSDREDLQERAQLETGQTIILLLNCLKMMFQEGEEQLF